MKRKSLKIGSAIVIAFFVFSTGLYAQGVDSRIGHPVMDATPITKADAEKKYPPSAGGYPPGSRDPHDAPYVIASPYPPYQKYDCKKISRGGLVLDTRAKKVFVSP